MVDSPAVQVAWVGDILLMAKLLKRSKQDQQLRCALAGAPAEMSLAQRLKRYLGIDRTIAKIAQGLPQRRAATGAFFDAGEGRGARLARPNDLAIGDAPGSKVFSAGGAAGRMASKQATDKVGPHSFAARFRRRRRSRDRGETVPG